MYRKFIFIFLSVFSFTYAVDEIVIEKRREEQQSFDNLIKSQNFNMSENNKDKEEVTSGYIGDELNKCYFKKIYR